MQTPPLPRSVPNGWIVLIGGGEFSFGETRDIDEFLLTKIPAQNRRIAFLPTASGSNEYAVHLAKYFKTLAPEVELINVPLYRHRDARRGKNLDLIFQAGMIYMGGGVTNTLLDVLRDSPAEKVIRTAVARGTVLAAIGAAANSLGRYAHDMNLPGNAIPGLNWLPDTVIETGFDPANDTELRRLMSLLEVRIGVGIPRRTALALDRDGAGQILGGGQVAIVRKPAAPMP